MSSVINIVQWETLKCCRSGIKCLLQFLFLNGRFKVMGLYSFSPSYWVSFTRMLSDWRMFRIKELLSKPPVRHLTPLTPGGHLRWVACPAVKWDPYTTDGHLRHVCKPAALKECSEEQTAAQKQNAAHYITDTGPGPLALLTPMWPQPISADTAHLYSSRRETHNHLQHVQNILSSVKAEKLFSGLYHVRGYAGF